MQRWKIVVVIIALAAFGVKLYVDNRPLVRAVVVGADVIEVTVRGSRPAQTVVVHGPAGSVEYGVNGDKVSTVKLQLDDGSVVFHVYRYSDEDWFRLTTEHRPGGWPGSIRRYTEETGALPVDWSN